MDLEIKVIETRNDLPTNSTQARAQGWKEISSGSYRVAYVNPEYPQFILKLVQDEEYCAHNERECILWEEHSETFFGFCLASIVARSEDYSAILMSKKHTFKWPETTEEMRKAASLAHRRNFVEVTRGENGGLDLHSGNWGYISDDYGYFVPGPIVDYAGY